MWFNVYTMIFCLPFYSSLSFKKDSAPTSLIHDSSCKGILCINTYSIRNWTNSLSIFFWASFKYEYIISDNEWPDWPLITSDCFIKNSVNFCKHSFDSWASEDDDIVWANWHKSCIFIFFKFITIIGVKSIFLFKSLCNYGLTLTCKIVKVRIIYAISEGVVNFGPNYLLLISSKQLLTALSTSLVDSKVFSCLFA